MKIKLDLYIREPAYFLTGDYDLNVIALDASRPDSFKSVRDGQLLTSIEVDISHIDNAHLTRLALDELKVEETELRARLQAQLDDIETRKQNILAITHKPGEWT